MPDKNSEFRLICLCGVVMKKSFTGLNNNQLKLIAMFSMLLDHAGRELLPQLDILPIIGRLAFPLFAYMIAEGCKYTKNKKKYFLIIALIALGCQAVYFIAMGSLYQNVLITFSLSIAIIFSVDNFIRKKNIGSFIPAFLISCAAVFLCVFLPDILNTTDFHIDYGLVGVLLPVAVYFAPEKKSKTVCFTVMLCILSLVMGSIQWYSLFTVPLIIMYNGKRGKLNLKMLFYIFYPAHLAVIHLIDIIIGL